MAKETFRKKISTKIKNSKLVEERHEQIFQAASKLIQKKGYHMTTLRDLSKETGISLGNLYDYITTKEDILYMIHEKAAQMVLEVVSQRMGDVRNPVEKLREMIERELEAMDRYQDLVMTIYQESHSLSKPSLRTMLRSEEAHIGRFKEVIEEGVETGVFKKANPIMLANIIKMMIDCWVLKRWDLRGKVSLEEMKQGILQMIQTGMMVKDEVNLVREGEVKEGGEVLGSTAIKA
jgi:AcrR family transcriptional regulator